MKTYVEVFHNTDGEKASIIFEILTEMGLKPSYGQHDFEYTWKKDVTFIEIIQLFHFAFSSDSGRNGNCRKDR